jgi:hypothetical protein
MRFCSKRSILAIAGIAAGLAMGLMFSGRAKAQAPSVTCAPGAKAGQCFKNVTTEALKGLSPDDFLSAMGVMADSLGLDCADCHPGAGTDKVDWVFDTPQKNYRAQDGEHGPDHQQRKFQRQPKCHLLRVPSRQGPPIHDGFAGFFV